MTIDLAVANIDGALHKLPIVCDWLTDVTVLSELKLPDNAYVNADLRALYNATLLASNRERKRSEPPQGGVGALINHAAREADPSTPPKPRISATLSAESKYGAATIVVQAAGHRALHIICVYMVPRGSPQNSPKKQWRRKLFTFLDNEVQRLGPDRDIIIAGDFNGQLGATGGRSTADTSRPTRDLLGFVRRHRLRSLFGSPWFPDGVRTSAPILGRPGSGRESDYIFVTQGFDMRRFTNVRAMTRDEWGPAMSSHLPLFATVALEPSTAAEPRNAPRRRRVPKPPPYADQRYNTFVPQLQRVLSNAAAMADSGATSFQTISTLQRDLAAATREHFSDPSDVLHPPPSMPRGAPTRSFRDGILPPPLVALLHSIRQHRRTLREVRLPASVRRFHTALLNAEHRSLIRSARQFHRQRQAALRRYLRSCCTHDLHGFYQVLHRIAHSDHRVTGTQELIPDEEGHLPAVQRFVVHNRDLCTETRPPPPAVESPAAMAFCPSTTAAQRHRWDRVLGGRIRWEEVYFVVFPTSQRDDVANVCAALGHHDGCRMCAHMQAALDSWNRDDPDSSPPNFTPQLHTSTAPGPDGLAAEFLRWTRAAYGGDRHADRRETCQYLARIFNQLLEEGDVPPAGFAESRTIVIRKKTAPNQASNPSDPDQYRAITMGNLIPKVLSLVIDARLLHWAVDCDIIGPEQVAFLPLRGCEMHVFTLLETIRHQWRRERDVYALFVDFRKAYDMVHQDALWAVLRHAGVPDQLVGLLSNWHHARTTELHINGTASEPFSYTKGVPQGEITSCILFIIFIESLARFLKSRPDLHGVDVSSRSVPLTVRLLLFADDLVTLASSPDELQRTLTYIDTWAQQWGFQLGIGNGKTEAMAFLHASSAATDTSAPPPAVTGLAPLVCNSGVVSWGTAYTYLGHRVHWNLSTSDVIVRRKARMQKLHDTAFQFNRLIRGMSIAALVQTMNTLTTGCMNYLFSVLPLTQSQLRTLDAQLRRSARCILGLPNRTPVGLVIAEAGLLDAKAHALMHRVRLMYTLQMSPFGGGIAGTLLRILARETMHGAGVTESWAHATRAAVQEARRLGAIVTRPASVYTMAPHLACLGRSLAYLRWRHPLCDGTRSNSLRNADRVVTSADRPPSFPPRDHVAALYFRAVLPPASAHGTHIHMLSLSYCGPKGGTAMARSTVDGRRHVAVTLAKLGSVALRMYPFRRPMRAYNDDDGVSVTGQPEAALPADGDSGSSDNDSSCSDDDSERRSDNGRRRYGRPVPCVFCGAYAADVRHLACECRSPRLAAAQQEIREAVPAMLTRFLRRISTDAARQLRGQPLQALRTAIDDAVDHLHAVDWASAEGRFLIHRALTVLPFAPEYVHPSMPRALAVARALHATCMKNHITRPACTIWTATASRLLESIASVWRAA